MEQEKSWTYMDKCNSSFWDHWGRVKGLKWGWLLNRYS